MKMKSRGEKDALFLFKHALHRWPRQHAVLPGGVVLELAHRQADALAPAVEDQCVAVDDTERITHHPGLAFEQSVDLLEIGVEVLAARGLEMVEDGRVGGEALRTADMSEVG